MRHMSAGRDEVEAGGEGLGLVLLFLCLCDCQRYLARRWAWSILFNLTLYKLSATTLELVTMQRTRTTPLVLHRKLQFLRQSRMQLSLVSATAYFLISCTMIALPVRARSHGHFLNGKPEGPACRSQQRQEPKSASKASIVTSGVRFCITLSVCQVTGHNPMSRLGHAISGPFV